MSTFESAVAAKNAIVSASAPNTTNNVRGTDRLAALPPKVLPMICPPPKRISSHGTVELAKPDTSVSVYAM